MTQRISDPNQLSPETKILWEKQEGIIIIYNLPFRLFETLRSRERQIECFGNGSSKKEFSNHEMNKEGTGSEAWDVTKWGKDGWSWKDEDIFWYQILGIMTVSLIASVKWGADWNGKSFWYDEKFRDYGHYERII